MITLALILAIILLIVILAALFYVPPATFGRAFQFVGAICALILFLIAVGVIHL